MKEIEIEVADGKRKIKIEKMGAMEGWEIQRKYVEFAMSKDTSFRVAYTMEVLHFAKVVQSGNELPLSTSAMIENHLQSWINIKSVFEAVLIENGINPSTHAEKEHYWAQAGGEMAAAFIENTVQLIGPLLKGKSEEA